MSAIPFTQIPENLLVPGMYQEIDNSLAGAPGDVKRVLIVDIKAQGGSAAVGVPIQSTSEAQDRELFGEGSPLALAGSHFRALNAVEDLWFVPLAEPSAGVATKKSVTFAVSTPDAGTWYRRIAGVVVSMATETSDTGATLATRFVALINSTRNLPVEAAVDGVDPAKANLTAVAKGVWGNGITITKVVGLSDPSGVTATVADATAGSGVPDVEAALGSLPPVRYHYLVSSVVDAISLGSFATELESRYGADRQIGGRLFVPISGVVGSSSDSNSMIGQLSALNSPHICPIPRGGNPPLPAIWVARVAARAIRILADDPAANTYATSVPGLTVSETYSPAQRQKLLEAGCSTYLTDAVGTLLIERLVTSYTEDIAGSRDTSYLDIQVVETADAIREYINIEARRRYGKYKLSSTSENFGSGSRVMTADMWKGFLVDLYSTVFIRGKQWCQDLESYKKSIIAQVKTGSKTRLEYRHQPNLIGQFLIGAGLMQFK